MQAGARCASQIPPEVRAQPQGWLTTAVDAARKNRPSLQAMSDYPSRANGARVLADVNALRAIGAYKSGVHKPTFSEAHMRSLEWLAARLPEEAGLSAGIDGIGNVLGVRARAKPLPFALPSATYLARPERPLAELRDRPASAQYAWRSWQACAGRFRRRHGRRRRSWATRLATGCGESRSAFG